MAKQMVELEGGGKWLRIAGWSFVALLLLRPAVAMQFTKEVQWTASDFIVMGALLGSVGLATEFLVRQTGNTAYRIGAVIAMVTAFLTVWVNLAVGMIGDDNPYNLLFMGVVALAVVGAILSGFRARGMARTMVVVAVAQALVAAGGIPSDPRGGVLSLTFAIPWLVAAALFARAARSQGTSTVSTGSGSAAG